MKSKRGSKFLKILNSKPIIGFFIFVMLSLANVFAGDIIVKEGSINIEDNLNADYVQASDFIIKLSPNETYDLQIIDFTKDLKETESLKNQSISMKEVIISLINTNQQLTNKISLLEEELCKKNKHYSWCENKNERDYE